MNRLPQADWTKRKDLAALVAALGPDNARYVGGAVRDTLLGKDIHDIDLATPLLPQGSGHPHGAHGHRSRHGDGDPQGRAGRNHHLAP